MNRTAQWTDEYARMLTDCEKRQRRLTEWEQNFVDSLQHQLGRGRIPTAKQIETLDTIWNRATAQG